MTVKLYSSGENIKNINGINVENKKYELAYNPNNNNNVHVSLTNNGLTIEKKFDSLENFFYQINNNKNGLINNLQKDLEIFKSMPLLMYPESITQKRKKHKKNKKKSSQKNLKRRRSVRK